MKSWRALEKFGTKTVCQSVGGVWGATNYLVVDDAPPWSPLGGGSDVNAHEMLLKRQFVTFDS